MTPAGMQVSPSILMAPPSEEQTPKQETIAPPVPETAEDTGLPLVLIEQLVYRMLHFRGEIVGRELAAALGLKFSLLDDLLETLKRQQLVTVRSSLGMGNISAMFALSEAGRVRARDCLERCQYTGPAPVPLWQYTEIVRRQKQQRGWLTQQAIANAYRKMVVSREVLAQIGPAVASGNSFLIYGQPGNGKTFLAEALVNIDRTPIFIPYAIEYQGNIVQVFDPIYHQAIDDDTGPSIFTFEPLHDRRWFKSRRPFIVSGGELTLDMLDLSYNSSTKVYDAPLHLKANNGIYLVDDFGRQRVTPAEVLNRWIVPMERRVAYLNLQSGGKLTVPFEAFLVFSTNLRPSQLGDEAFLRRIQYKMHLRNPDEREFSEIFRRYCEAHQLPFTEAVLSRFIEVHYRCPARPFRRCHPRDVLSHAMNLIEFEQSPFVLTDDVLDRAIGTCFTADAREE